MTVTTDFLLRRHCHFPNAVLAVASFDPCNASALHAARLAVTAIPSFLTRLLAKPARGRLQWQRELME